MLKFNLYLLYDGDSSLRPVALGCSKEQLLDVLNSHLMLAEVDNFIIVPEPESTLEFREFTL